MASREVTCPRCKFEDAKSTVLAMIEDDAQRGEVNLIALNAASEVSHEADCPGDPENLRHSCGCYMEDNMGGHAPDCDRTGRFDEPGRYDDPADPDDFYDQFPHYEHERF